MTQPPKSSTAPPGAPTMPGALPQQGSPAPAAPGPVAPGPAPTAVAPSRRTAFAEGVDQLRAVATTEPGRLRIIGAVLALLVVAFGAVTAWQATDRAAAADDVLNNSQPLSSAAADIYRSLADANTAASSGFLAGGQETKASRERYEKDIRTAAEKLVLAANNSEPNSRSAETISKLNRLLPEYKGLIERARANNRQGYPLGGAYLRYANATMQTEMLPAAEDLYKTENERLRDDYAHATPYPWAAIALGVLALAALAWAQHRTYVRTNRVLNHGLVAATATTTVVLLWLVIGHSVARAGLNDSYDHGVRSLNVLHDARIASLKARGNENLTLVSRGAETVEVGGEFKDKFDVAYQASMKDLAAGLAAAEDLADDQAGEQPVRAAAASMDVWKERHQQARDADDAGDYQAALSKIIGSKDDEPTGECFDNVDRSLETALKHETLEFEQAAGDGRDAMTGLPAGAAVLAVLGATGAVLGIGRRLSEYR
ncbi:hypothetical protein [Streptomyces sp. TRM70350]|uniref:hypothetical protein n=1 Tax=Streptomyces sp. TRM70350 TaxID=2856165 RepID=UPI001C458C3E|nr:hypothetical protein [Streptomyces sp. TRM70350]MBV7699265.1 hypothetical protein [Streptomyces sp. TRM70350]